MLKSTLDWHNFLVILHVERQFWVGYKNIIYKNDLLKCYMRYPIIDDIF